MSFKNVDHKMSHFSYPMCGQVFAMLLVFMKSFRKALKCCGFRYNSCVLSYFFFFISHFSFEISLALNCLFSGAFDWFPSNRYIVATCLLLSVSCKVSKLS